LGKEDDEAIQRIRERWGLSSDTDAIRLAVRVVAAAERLEVVMPDQAPGETAADPQRHSGDATQRP
jgi:hypothetical protein